MEEMLGKSIIGHVLGHQESLISFSTATDQIHQPFVPHLPNSCCLSLTKSCLFPEKKKKGKNNHIYLLSNKMTDPAFILMKNNGPITQILISCFPFHFLTIQTRQDTKSPGPTSTLSVSFTFPATKQKKKKNLILTTNC